MITRVKRVHRLENQSRMGKNKTPLVTRKLLPQTSALLFGGKSVGKKHSLGKIGNFLVAATELNDKDLQGERMNKNDAGFATPLRETYSAYYARNCFSKSSLLKVPLLKKIGKNLVSKRRNTEISGSLLKYSEVVIPNVRGKPADVSSACIQYNLSQQEYFHLRSEFIRLETQGRVPCHSLSREYSIPATCFLGIVESCDSLTWKEFLLFHKLFITRRSSCDEITHYLSTLNRFDKNILSSSVNLPKFAKATLQKLIPFLVAEMKPHSVSLVDLRILIGRLPESINYLISNH